jgi:hypothetical protein
MHLKVHAIAIAIAIAIEAAIQNSSERMRTWQMP